MDDWRSYDEVADRYERIHAPRFAKPAADLVALAGIGAGQTVLDVGTGTGIAAAAAAAAGADAVFGIDPSTGMLSVAKRERPNILIARA
ncbi:MAG: methyltransferase domain-containing protein, partial [Actinobacteria bacterium]|nr:methyltransferase domain-containing protein [Actinomycetota bacterium]